MIEQETDDNNYSRYILVYIVHVTTLCAVDCINIYLIHENLININCCFPSSYFLTSDIARYSFCEWHIMCSILC